MHDQVRKADARFRALLEKQEQERVALVTELNQEAALTNTDVASQLRTDVAESLRALIEQLENQIRTDGRSRSLEVSFRAAVPPDATKLRGKDPHDPDRLQAIVYIKVPSPGHEPRAYALLDVTEAVFTYVDAKHLEEMYVR